MNYLLYLTNILARYARSSRLIRIWLIRFARLPSRFALYSLASLAHCYSRYARLLSRFARAYGRLTSFALFLSRFASIGLCLLASLVLYLASLVLVCSLATLVRSLSRFARCYEPPRFARLCSRYARLYTHLLDQSGYLLSSPTYKTGVELRSTSYLRAGFACFACSLRSFFISLRSSLCFARLARLALASLVLGFA